MCYDQGHIQSYIDSELTSAEMEETREHIGICEECRALYQKLLDNELLVKESMAGFLAADRDRFNAELAWQKLKAGNAINEIRIEKGAKRKNMKYRKLFTAAAAVLAVAGLFSFSPVRSMASDFLTIFRVEKVGVIAITPQDMAQMERVMREGSGLVDIKNFGRVEVSGRPEVRAVTLQEARGSVDFDLKVPDIKDYGKPALKMTSGTSVSLFMDVANVNAALKAMGSSERLPDELNGKEFNLVVPPGVSAEYTGEAGKKLMLAQSRGPSIKTSSGVDVKAIRQALLSIPALPENLRNQLAAVDDWQHTALIPVKAGQYSEVKVGGSGGVFVRGDSAGHNQMNALVWQKSGVIYVLAGDLEREAAMNIAGGMK